MAIEPWRPVPCRSWAGPHDEHARTPEVFDQLLKTMTSTRLRSDTSPTSPAARDVSATKDYVTDALQRTMKRIHARNRSNGRDDRRGEEATAGQQFAVFSVLRTVWWTNATNREPAVAGSQRDGGGRFGAAICRPPCVYARGTIDRQLSVDRGRIRPLSGAQDVMGRWVGALCHLATAFDWARDRVKEVDRDRAVCSDRVRAARVRHRRRPCRLWFRNNP